MLTDREDVVCPLCDVAPRVFGIDFQGLSLARCGSCGLECQSPRPTFEQLEREVYGDAYHPPAHAALDKAQTRVYRRQIARLESLVGSRARRSLLDVGCGAGAFMRYATSRGWQVEGTDVVVTPWARATPARIWKGQLPAIDFSTGVTGTERDPPRFDVVRFNHVLEHTPDPLAELRRAYELLVPGGVVLIGVPNMAGLSIRLKSWQSRLGLKHKAWKHYGALHHLWFFTPRTLTALVERAGFEVATWETPVEERPDGACLVRAGRRAMRQPIQRATWGGILDLYAGTPQASATEKDDPTASRFSSPAASSPW